MATKVKTIKVTNLRAVGSAELNLNGCSVLVIGKNRSGKTTILRALPDRLRGEIPDTIIKENETEAGTEWELTDGTKLIWSLDTKTKKGERLIIVTHDEEGKEERGSITEDLMKKYFPETFDVDAFLLATPAKQRKILQSLAGLDFTKIDDRYKVAYDDRTYANKKRDEAKLLVKPVNTSLPTELQDTKDIEAEIAGIETHNDRYKLAQNKVSGYKTDVQRKQDEVVRINKEIARLEELRDEQQKEVSDLQDKIKEGETWLLEPANSPKTEKENFELNKKLQQIIDQNDLIIKNNRAIELRDAADKFTEEATAADKKVNEILAEKDKMIKSAKMPEGFGFTDEGITYDGLPFEKLSQASSAIYIAGLKLAAMKTGEVKTLHFDASFLDKNSLAEVEDWAQKNNLQLLIERPDWNAGEIRYELITDIK